MTRWGGIVLKGGCCDGDPPVCVLVSPSCLRGGRVEWREWCVLWCPRVRIGSGILRHPASLCIIPPLSYCLVSFLSCVAVCAVGGEVGWCGGLCSALLCSSVPSFVFAVTALLV